MTDLLQNLRTGTDDICDFLSTIDEEDAIKKPNAEAWSILEIMEHIFITEKGIYKLLNRPDLFSNKPGNSSDNWDKYNNGKFKAPDITLPKGRFSSVAEVTVAFDNLRSQLEEYLINELPRVGIDTYPHPILGPLTKPQWIEFAIEHGQRHLVQMKSCKP